MLSQRLLQACMQVEDPCSARSLIRKYQDFFRFCRFPFFFLSSRFRKSEESRPRLRILCTCTKTVHCGVVGTEDARFRHPREHLIIHDIRSPKPQLMLVSQLLSHGFLFGHPSIFPSSPVSLPSPPPPFPPPPSLLSLPM